MNAPSSEEHGSGASFFPVHIDSIDNDTLPMDLYIRFDGAEPTLYRSTGIDFTREDRDRLIAKGMEFLYIPMSQHGIYREALSRRLEAQFTAPDKSKAERGRMVRASCVRMVEDAMLFPGNPGAIGAIEEVGKLFAQLAASDQSNFSYILDMSAHDYYTITHMVNVGVGCGLLAQQLRPKEPDLIATIIQGGLLHDLGKRQVPSEILNKEGKLSDDEWNLIRKHPAIGYEELCKHPGINPIVLEMTRDHHERLDGQGYPDKVRGPEISFAARLCAVVDVYDAITAARPYRGPIPPADALRLMTEGIGTQFDETIFNAWHTLVERLIREDPGRAPEHGGKARSLAALSQRSATAPVAGATLVGMVPVVSEAELPERREGTYLGDRRIHPRRNCSLLVIATFERQMKECGIRPGQAFEARICDLSRGGIQIQTPWPLSQNDLLSLEIRSGDGIVKRRIRIVRVRRNGEGRWIAGACFVAVEGQQRRTA